MPQPQKSKLEKMRDLLEEFDSPQDAMLLLRDLHREKAHKKHMDQVAPFGKLTVTDWAALETYLETLPTGDVPLHDLLARASAEIQAAIATQSTEQLFGLLWLIAKAVKPHHLYKNRGSKQ